MSSARSRCWFFALDASEGFVIVGGAALLALGIGGRPTQDVDFFTDDETRIQAGAAGLSDAAVARGWTCEVVRDSGSFTRLRLARGATVVAVDLATDVTAARPLVESEMGPTFAPLEHAARKALALFDRAAARDYVDLHALAERFDRRSILALAASLDLGFDEAVFAQMLRAISRFTDDELPCEPERAPAVRDFANHWAAELEGGTQLERLPEP